MGVFHDVGALGGLEGFGVPVARGGGEAWDALAAQDKGGGGFAVLQGQFPGDGGFRGVRGPEGQEGGAARMVPEFLQEADLGFLFHRLVGGAVFSHPEGVVGPDVDNRLFHEGGEADGGFHVVGEHEEGAAGGDKAAVEGKAGEQGAHGEFGNAGLEEGAAEVSVPEGSGGFEEAVGFIRVGEIRGGDDHIAQVLGEPCQNGGGGGAGGDSFFLRDAGEVEFGEFAGDPAGKFGGVFGVGPGPAGFGGGPFGGGGFFGFDEFGHGFGDAGEGGEGVGWVAAEVGDGFGEVGAGGAEGLAVGGDFFLEGLPLGVQGALSHDGFSHDEGWPVLLRESGIEGSPEGLEVTSIHFNHVPAPGLVLGGGIFGGDFGGGGGELDVVGIVEHHEVVQAEGSGDASGALGDFFLDAAVGDEGVVGVGHPVAEAGLEEFVGDCGAHGENVALAEGAGGVFDAPLDVEFGVAGGGAVPLAEVGEFVGGEEAVEAQGGVEHGGHVAGVQKEAVAFEPAGVGGVEGEVFGVEEVDEFGAAHGTSGMAGFGLFHHGGGEDADLVRGGFQFLIVHLYFPLVDFSSIVSGRGGGGKGAGSAAVRLQHQSR